MVCTGIPSVPPRARRETSPAGRFAPKPKALGFEQFVLTKEDLERRIGKLTNYFHAKNAAVASSAAHTQHDDPSNAPVLSHQD
jgi:hypothetical protein